MPSCRRADATGDTERLLRQVVAAVRGGDRDELRAALTGAPTPIGLRLTADDHGQIEAVLGRSNDLYRRIGDCGAEYRR